MKLIHFMSFQELLDGYCLLRVDTVTRVSVIRGFQLLPINVVPAHYEFHIAAVQISHVHSCVIQSVVCLSLKPEVILCRYRRCSACFCCFFCI